MTLAAVDDLIPAIYFVFVLGIGWALNRSVSTSEDFLASGRGVPVWITSLAFVAASHALANTTKQGESCEVCHGPTGDFSVSKVHAW